MNSLVLWLVALSVLVVPVAPVSAATATDVETISSLEAQLTAIRSYLSRLNGKAGELSTPDLQQSITNGVEWIINSQEENGHFRYEYVPYEDVYHDDDNIVRQAGALYILGEVYRQQTQKDPELAEAIERSIGYFASLTHEPDPEDGEFLCVLDPVHNIDCRLGATSLALLGVLSYVEGAPGKLSEYQPLIDGYVASIVASKNPEAGLRDRYRVRVGWLSTESPFSSGEALLALVRYYQLAPNEPVKDLIDETYTHLSGQEYNSGLYLWIMAALKDMVELWPEAHYIEYTTDFTKYRINKTLLYKGTDKNYCAYTEGIASAYSVLNGYVADEELAFIRSEMRYWNTHNAELQIGLSDAFRVVKHDEQLTLKRLPSPKYARGGFLTSHSNEVQRIDFTQHCVSAYLQTLVDIEGKTL